MELSEYRRSCTRIVTIDEVAHLYVRYSERRYFLSERRGEEEIWRHMITLRDRVLDREVEWRIKIGIDLSDALSVVENHFWHAVEDAECRGGLPPMHLPRCTMTCSHPLVD